MIELSLLFMTAMSVWALALYLGARMRVRDLERKIRENSPQIVSVYVVHEEEDEHVEQNNGAA